MSDVAKVGTVLALDIATTTGWAWHRPGMPRPFFGAVPLPSEVNEVGEPIAELLLWLRNLYIGLKNDGSPITHIFYEMPFINPRQINSRTSKRLMGLAGVVEMFAYQVKMTGIYEVDIAEWRKHFLGRGGGFKREKKWSEKKQKMVPGKYLPGHDPKELAIQQCARFGWHTNVHDAAEACGLLDYALTMIPDYERPWRDNALMGGML